MSLFDEVVAITKEFEIRKDIEENLKKIELDKRITSEVNNRYLVLLKDIIYKIKDEASNGKNECIINIGTSEWIAFSENFYFKVNKVLTSKILEWLETEGFSDIENISFSEQTSDKNKSIDTVILKIKW